MNNHSHDDLTYQDPEHPRDHEHPHDHEQHPHNHDHSPQQGWGWLAAVVHLPGHSHSHSDHADRAWADNEAGIRTVWMALAALLLTSLIQIVIVAWSGSVALLADTVHNIGDMLNSIPVLIAFYLARQAATRRYTYGFARAEDVAGVFVVLSIAFSAGVIFWESFQKLLHPQPIDNLGWVALAAVVGFLGNEAVAWWQIRVGRQIGSATLVADGLHARTDGFTSLAVLIAAGGSWLGFPLLDPVIGLLIGVVVLFITREAAVTIWYRLMDAIDPALLAQAEAIVAQQAGVKELRRLRMRWMGHTLHAEVYIAVEPHLTTAESHHISEQVRHALFHNMPRLSEIVVHVEPWSPTLEPEHQLTLDHESLPRPITTLS